MPRLTTDRITELALGAGLLNPRTYPRKKTGGAIVYVLRHGPDDGRRETEISPTLGEDGANAAIGLASLGATVHVLR
jgi:hypothetical protein